MIDEPNHEALAAVGARFHGANIERTAEEPAGRDEDTAPQTGSADEAVEKERDQ
jgi:hypothetical protein